MKTKNNSQRIPGKGSSQESQRNGSDTVGSNAEQRKNLQLHETRKNKNNEEKNNASQAAYWHTRNH